MLEEEEAAQREVTPEPSEPLHDLYYIHRPVSTIVNPDSTLPQLIEAYSVLAARLRMSVSEDLEIETSWPLFQPLRKNRDLFHTSLVRDLQRALVDPMEARDSKVMLPSPRHSPKKKGGMTADQVKYARDLCTTCHSVLKLLAIILTVPALFSLFTTSQLREILNGVLAIPLSFGLPTINARKTYALSVWLIQVQRLPSDILFPAADRIASALGRGIDGELGKEGKKGSASDGLRAIHDLSIYQPETFIPSFAVIFPSVLCNLTAPSIALRLQACNALSGFATGFISLPRKYFHTRITNELCSYLKVVPANSSPSKRSPDSDGLKVSESPIIRTLRIALQNTEPTHVVQGPVWGASILASFIVILGPVLKADRAASRIISTMLTLLLRNKGSAMRSLTAIIWRCVSWAYLQPSLPLSPDVDSDDEFEDSERKTEEATRVSEAFWKITTALLDTGVGTCLIAGLLGRGSEEEGDPQRVLQVLRGMVKGPYGAYLEGMMVIRQLVRLEPTDGETEWDADNLLPRSFFNASSGVLTTDMSSLHSVLAPMFQECPDVSHIRSLTVDELNDGETMKMLCALWKEGLRSFGRFNDQASLTELSDTWTALTKACIQLKRATGDEPDLATCAVEYVTVLVDFLKEPEFWLVKETVTSPKKSPGPHGPRRTPSKLQVVRQLWKGLQNVFSREDAERAAQTLLSFLMQHEQELAQSDVARTQWTKLCVRVVLAINNDALRAFWGEGSTGECPAVKQNWTLERRSFVWRRFLQEWMQTGEGSWEGGLIILGVPFAKGRAWDLSSKDLELWEQLLTHGVDKALDHGIDPLPYLDSLGEAVSQSYDPTFTSSTRIAELLMSHAESSITDAREVPAALMSFVNDTLRSNYPPSSDGKPPAMWMIRTLTRMIDHCASELLSSLLESIQDGMSVWVADEHHALDQTCYNDVLSLWEMTLSSMRALRHDVSTMETFSPLFESVFCDRERKPREAFDAFDEFWSATFKHTPSTTWPAKVQGHYDLLTCGPSIDDSEGDMIADLTSAAPVPSSPCPSAPSTPTRAPPIPLFPFHAPSTPVCDIVVRPMTPPRPHKSPMPFHALPFSSPVSPSAKRSVPGSSPDSPSANKRRRVEKNKENESPREIMTPPSSPSPIVGKGKRRVSDSWLDERPMKRKRRSHSDIGLSGDESENEVERTLLDPKPDEMVVCKSEVASTSSTPRRRKGIFLEAVVVPTLREALARMASDAGGDTAPQRRSLRRRAVSEKLRHPQPVTATPVRQHRQKALRIQDTPRSSELSSDDDPYLGQVTPHHLISPAIRRSMREEEEEEEAPGSDDSGYMPASPTRDVVIRRMQRTIANVHRRLSM